MRVYPFSSPARTHMHFSLYHGDAFALGAKLQFPHRQRRNRVQISSQRPHSARGNSCTAESRHVIEDKITPECAAVEINWYSSTQIESVYTHTWCAQMEKVSQYADANSIFFRPCRNTCRCASVGGAAGTMYKRGARRCNRCTYTRVRTHFARWPPPPIEPTLPLDSQHYANKCAACRTASKPYYIFYS
jgi:hypothetical protein